MPELQTDQSRLDQLAEAFAERYRRGERPSVSEYVRNNPDLAEQIEELFPALAMMEQVDHDLRQRATPSEMTQPAEPSITELGDFRIIREVGRGGMGIVYEAEQVSLGRRVALKLLPKQTLLDTRHQKRFLREAKAAARLHHTNIVPVFGVGQQDELHYYVMQFIHGLGLDEVLVELQRQRELSGDGVEGRELRVESAARDVSAAAVANSLMSGHFQRTLVFDDESDQASAVSDQPTAPSTLDSQRSTGGQADTVVGQLSDTFPGHSVPSTRSHSRAVYWQSVARIGLQAAQALQYAHDQGIIHRDIKPGNLLLDTCGSVWVTDFGLAKAADQQDLTHTGDVLGTLRYMAPEQFDGQADARSDIFSLGLTLYELLALKPAFDERDRHKLIRQVTTGSPTRLRTMDPHIPRDLETIVHKAIDRDPAHRYQTAGELAADLQRYLGDEPIRARWISPVTRFARWCRRNPAVAGLTSAIGVLVTTAAVVSSIAAIRFENLAEDNAGLVAQANQEKSAAEAARQTAEESQRQAESARQNAETGRKLSQWNAYVAQLRLLSNAWIAGDYGELDYLLDQMVPVDGSADFRHWEWYYLRDQVDQRRQEVPGHVRQAHWSRDGRFLATVSDTIELRDAGSLAILKRLGDRRRWTAVALSSDTKLLAAGTGDGTVRIFEIASGALIDELTGMASSISSLCFSPDGGQLCVGTHKPKGAVWVWTLVEETAGQCFHTAADGYVPCVDWHPERPWIVSAHEDGKARVWNVATGECVWDCSPSGIACFCAMWSPDGSRLLAGGDLPSYGLSMWDVDGKLIGQLPSAGTTIRSACWSTDGQYIVACGRDQKLTLYSAATLEVLETLSFHPSEVRMVDWSSDGRVVSVSQTGAFVCTPGAQNPAAIRLESNAANQRHSAARNSVCWSPDGRQIAVASADGIRIRDSQTTEEIHAWPVSSVRLTAVAWRADGSELAAIDQNGTIVIVSFPTGTQRIRITTSLSHNPYSTLDWSMDGRWIASGGGPKLNNDVEPSPRLVEIWNAATGTLKHTVQLTQSEVVRFATDSRRLAIAPWQLRVEDVVAEQKLCRIHEGNETADLAWSPDAMWIATGTRAGAVHLFDMTARKLVATQYRQGHSVMAVAWSHDGARIASGGADGSIVIWDTATFEMLLKIPGETRGIRSLSWSPDDRRILAAGVDGIRIWGSAAIGSSNGSTETLNYDYRGVSRTNRGATAITQSD